MKLSEEIHKEIMFLVKDLSDEEIKYVKELCSKVAQLEAELEDWRAASEKVLNEECAPDEKHCTCVPFLRKRIDELEAT